MPWQDKSAQGDQKNERDRLIKQGKSPAEASRLAKKRFPLPKKQAAKKNKQPKEGERITSSGKTVTRGRGKSIADDGSGRQSGAFGASKHSK